MSCQPWIQTYTGRKVEPFTMTAFDIDIVDIAHALSMLSRYTGHCPFFYSVAEHSILVSRQVPERYALWGLLHDAAEAYIGDAARPVKIRPEWGFFRDLEKRIMLAVAHKFKLELTEPGCVKSADNLLLATEAFAFFGHTVAYRDWVHQPSNGFPIDLGIKIKYWPPGIVEQQFLERYESLCNKAVPTTSVTSGPVAELPSLSGASDGRR